MMKNVRSSLITWSLIVLSSTTFLGSPVAAQEGDYVETFDDPALPGWEYSEGVSVTEGVMHMEPGNFAFLGGDWGDSMLSIRLRHFGEGETIIGFHVVESRSYRLILDGGSLSLHRMVEDESAELSSAPVEVPDGEWVNISDTVANGVHQVALNGELLFSATDPDPLPPGSLILETLGDRIAEIDELSLRSGEAILPADEEPIQEDAEGEAPAAAPPSQEESGLTWVRTGGPPGGLGYDIRYNFADPNIWYVTDSFAGLHISTDDGLTWQPSITGIPAQAGATGDIVPIFSATVDPLDPQIVWVGTQNTGHIYKSTDGGQTWVQHDNGVTIQYDLLSFRGFTIDPRSSDIVYAMAETTSNSPNPDTTGGIIYKTTDGGANWQVIWDGGMPSSLTRYMWIDPRDPDVLYVSTGIFDRGAIGEGDLETQPFGGLGVLKSTDGGQTWRELNESNGLRLLYIGSLYMHPDNPDILLAAAGHLRQGDASMHIESMIQAGQDNPAGIYRTTDGGEHWTQTLAAVPEIVSEGFTVVEMCPSEPDIAYAASQKSVYRSDDAGQTWTLVSGGSPAGWGSPGVVAGWPIDFQCDPRNEDRVFANNYGGGNFLSEDGGRTWTNASQGYTGALTTDVVVDPADPARVFAVGRTGIWGSNDGGITWNGLNYLPSELTLSECLGVSLDPSDPDHILLGCAPGVTIIESHDGGSSWEVRDSLTERTGLDESPFPAVGTIVFAPSDPLYVYAGVGQRGSILLHEPGIPSIGLFASRDGGATWQAVSDDRFAEETIHNLAIDPTDAGVVYAATEVGLFVTTDAGTDWTLMSGLPEGARIRAVAINPTNAQNLVIGIDGLGIYISTDGGQSWANSSAGLEPNSSLHDIVFDPTNAQILYASDYLSGVYRSTDGGQTWQSINNGLRNHAALGLSISSDGQHLYVATNGEGVYRLDVSGVAATSTSEESPAPDREAQLPDAGAPAKGVPILVIGLILLIAFVVAGIIWFFFVRSKRVET